MEMEIKISDMIISWIDGEYKAQLQTNKRIRDQRGI